MIMCSTKKSRSLWPIHDIKKRILLTNGLFIKLNYNTEFLNSLVKVTNFLFIRAVIGFS